MAVYTQVVAKPNELTSLGFKITLIADGPGLETRTKEIVTKGQEFSVLWLRQQAIAFKREIDFDDVFMKEIVQIAGQPIDLTPIEDTPPTQDQLDAAEFLRLVRVWMGKRVMVAEKFLPAGDADASKTAVADFYAAAKDQQKLVYEGLMADSLRAFIALP